MKTNNYIHPTAIIEKNVKIGERASVWHHCHLRQDTVLGDDVSLGKGVFIDQGVTIGAGSRIQNGVNVYNGVIITEWVFVGPNVTFTNDKYPRAGSKNWKLSETYLMPGCSIGAGSVLSSEITIGSFALVGAGSVLMSDVLPFHLAYGLPAKSVSKICACGNTRLDFSTPKEEYIQSCCSKNLRDEVIALAKQQIALL
jgi:UDP-2-acetamido-3-amino-2,3-dideoxy-glucuronate N-acetyltransferase